MSDTPLNTTGDPDPPDGADTGIKPPTATETATSEGDIGIKPPTGSVTSEGSTTAESTSDTPIVIPGG